MGFLPTSHDSVARPFRDRVKAIHFTALLNILLKLTTILNCLLPLQTTHLLGHSSEGQRWRCYV